MVNGIRKGAFVALPWGLLFLLFAPLVRTANAAPFDAARAFGARPSVADLSLAPDGMHFAYIEPAKGQGAVLVTSSFKKGSQPKPILLSDGKPFRLLGCDWVSNDRLVCQIFGII